MREKAKPTVQIDDDKVKVTRWDFYQGQKQGGTGTRWIMSSCL